MKSKGPYRALSRIEQAFTVINQTFPLTAMGVVRLVNGPAPGRLRRAIDRLQLEHPVLQVAIRRQGEKYFFQPCEGLTSIPLEVLPRESDFHWRSVAARVLNEAFDPSAAPLMRFIYVFPDATPSGGAELIIAYHHAIGDALSGLHCLHQLLSWCAGEEGTEDEDRGAGIFPPAAESLFPKSFRGLSLAVRLLPFMGRQLREELAFRRENAKGAAPAIPGKAANGLLHLALDPQTSRQLITRSRREQVSVAGMLAAAMLLAVWEKRYRKHQGRYRAVIFSDLRPYLKPPLGNEVLGCFNSLLRISQKLEEEPSFWEVARSTTRQIYRSGKRGERFLYAFLSKDLVTMNLRQADQRLGAVALSYVGPLDLQPAYGTVRVVGVHGSVTNNPLGAELSAFGKLIDGRIELDLQYLTAEMDAPTAQELVRNVEDRLKEALG